MSDQVSVNDTDIEADVDEMASDSARVHDESVDEMHTAANSSGALVPIVTRQPSRISEMLEDLPLGNRDSSLVQGEEVAVEIWPPSVTEHSGLEQLLSPCDTSRPSHVYFSDCDNDISYNDGDNHSDTDNCDCTDIDINESNICLFHFHDFYIGNGNRNNEILSVIDICNYSFFSYNIHNRNFRFVRYNGSNSISSLLSTVHNIVFNIFYMCRDTDNRVYANIDINVNNICLLHFHNFYIGNYNTNNETLSVLDIGNYSFFSYNIHDQNFWFVRYSGSNSIPSVLSTVYDIVFNIFYICRDTDNSDYTNTVINENNVCLLRFRDFYIGNYNRHNETLSVFDIGNYSFFSYNIRNRNFHFVRYNGSNSILYLLSIVRDIVFSIFYMCRDTGNHDYTYIGTNGNNICLLNFHDFRIGNYNRNNETLSFLDTGNYSFFSYNIRNRNFGLIRFNGSYSMSSLLSTEFDIVFNRLGMYITYICYNEINIMLVLQLVLLLYIL
ncbi:TBC1 domain family member 5 homolog A-like isoform X2 [Schistocerca cancellata]|nr:TBC1 domain family member 5 homolog A-like isoform X2 [Schistocerca cancellata]XP_049763535.1 TBC1 domain family member 5 homolog A-like isoform X2 [Schistocerca cancellata]